jgi:hypothetical protein
MSNILMTGVGLARAELPHLQATMSDIRQNPSNAASDILEFFKGLWANITSSGILPVRTNHSRVRLTTAKSNTTIAC